MKKISLAMGFLLIYPVVSFSQSIELTASELLVESVSEIASDENEKKYFLDILPKMSSALKDFRPIVEFDLAKEAPISEQSLQVIRNAALGVSSCVLASSLPVSSKQKILKALLDSESISVAQLSSHLMLFKKSVGDTSFKEQMQYFSSKASCVDTFGSDTINTTETKLEKLFND